MSDPRWTVDEDGDLIHARPDGAYGSYIFQAGNRRIGSHVTSDGFAALVECVRSHDTLTQARELIAEYARHHNEMNVYGFLARLTDLLTGEGQSDNLRGEPRDGEGRGTVGVPPVLGEPDSNRPTDRTEPRRHGTPTPGHEDEPEANPYLICGIPTADRRGDPCQRDPDHGGRHTADPDEAITADLLTGEGQ